MSPARPDYTRGMSVGLFAGVRHVCALATFGALLATSGAANAAQSRTSYVVTEVTNANAGLSASIRAEKYTLMKASAFAFFRGTNHLYWKDLGNSPSLYAYGAVSTSRIWLGGDMHVDNTGSFGDDQGDVVFGLNDFDEAAIGDYQLDVWRMAVSLVLVARENGFGASEQGALLDSFSNGGRFWPRTTRGPTRMPTPA